MITLLNNNLKINKILSKFKRFSQVFNYHLVLNIILIIV
jgi:hypothetical protein